MMEAGQLNALRDELRQFVAERDWEQFHSPKNVATALAVEAAELLEPFQWLTQDQSRALPPEKLQAVGDEIADVLIYLVRLSDLLGLDPMQAAYAKLERNRQKYPAHLVRGKSLKYNEYSQTNPPAHDKE